MSDTKKDLTGFKAADEGVDGARRGVVTYLAVGVGLAAAGLLAPHPAYASYGRCYKCSCCAFEGTQNTCSNCGHAYTDHTGQTCEKSR